MNILIIENLKDNWLNQHIGNNFHGINLSVETIPVSISSSYYLSLLSELKNKKKKIDTFIIPVSLCEPHSDFFGLKLGVSIRLAYEFPEYCLKPILFMGSESITELKKYSEYASILDTEGVKYIEYSLEELINYLDDPPNFGEKEVIYGITNKLFLPKPPISGRHSIANEWAIYRLADALGCLKSIEKNPNFSNLIHNSYFRLILNRIHYQEQVYTEDLNKLFKEQKLDKATFLLIDDKAELGWNSVLTRMLEMMGPKNKLICFSDLNVPNIDNSIYNIINQISKESFDLVFLDLRLIESDETKSLQSITDIHDFSGAKVLKVLKKRFPALPIIIFTASQQAWNVDKLYDIGADGYFIKESPENIFNNEIFISNIKSLVQTINEQVKKGKELRYFYDYGLQIKESLDKNSFSSNIKNRIERKLELAFSMLITRRREYEKENFIYSDYQFAFLIYWSILIEFQVEKIGSYKSPRFDLLNGKTIIDNNMSNYIRTTEWSNIPVKWMKKFSSLPIPRFYINNTSIDISKVKNHYRNLSNLIPIYILTEKGSSSNSYIDEFSYLNQIRNGLDYTHSDENVVKTEPIHTQANEEEDLEICKDMFKFIFFLIVGKAI